MTLKEKLICPHKSWDDFCNCNEYYNEDDVDLAVKEFIDIIDTSHKQVIDRSYLIKTIRKVFGEK